MHVGRFGKIAPGTIVDLWYSEVEFIQSNQSPEWEDVSEENLEGVGTIVPAKTGSFDLTNINWLQEARPSLRRLSRTELSEAADSMRKLGCHIPPESETRDWSREALFETLYGEVKRLRWDQPGYQAIDRASLRDSGVPVITKPDSSSIPGGEDAPETPSESNPEEVEDKPLDALRPVRKIKRTKP